MRITVLVLLISSFVPLFPPAVRAAEVTVFAAASLKTALDEVAAGWQAATGHRAVLSYAASSTLARQIEAGAPADVYISANTDWMDHLARRGLIATASRIAPLSNRLVLIAPGDSAPNLTLGPAVVERLEGGRLAMALVEAVPVGIYGRAALENLGLWDALAPHVAQTDNARTALALVARGEAPLGVVYATDAGASDAVSIVAHLPASAHPPIRYAMAAVAEGDDLRASEFLNYATGPAGRAAFESHGFGWVGDP